jgi:hypothetical protein
MIKVMQGEMWRIANEFGKEEKSCEPMGEILGPKRSELDEILILRTKKENQSRRREKKRRGGDSVDVKLVAEMEEKASRLTSETTGDRWK